MNGSSKAHRIVAVTATALMIGLSFAAASGSTYRYSFLFLAPLLWGVYALRNRLCLYPFHLGLFASALLLHNLGVFGLYRQEFLNLWFDTYVHFYFGVVCAALLHQMLACAYGLKTWRLWTAVILGILGCGAIHELIEWGSTMLLGPERGMLKTLAEDPYDTQKDLLNNLLGTLLALTCAALYQRMRKRPVGEPVKDTDAEPSSTRSAQITSSSVS
jgi:hypothetical protein